MRYKTFFWKNRLLCLFLLNASKLGNSQIHSTCRLDATSYIDTRHGQVAIGEGSTIHRFAMIVANGGDIVTGSGLSLNPYSILYSGSAGLIIGDNVRIAAHVVVVPENHNYHIIDFPIRFQGLNSKGIVIGSDVWIGAGAKILDGSFIGDGCVIAAKAVVRGNISTNTVVAVVPAKLIKLR
jgi:acetyltransferase-like isoleucine patch superfamily enzyme